MKLLALLLALSATLPVASFAQYFTDMFTGAALNVSYWRSQSPFGDSSVVQSGGAVAITNAGKIVTASPLSGTLDVTFKFAFTGSNYDSFRIHTRTFGFGLAEFFDRGIQFSFRMRSDGGQTTGNISIDGPRGNLATGTYPIALNQTYAARIIDDGTRLSFYVNDLSTPLLQATDTSVFGKFFGFSNREGSAGGSSISAGAQVKISAFTVNAASVIIVEKPVTVNVPYPVPDTTSHLVNMSTLGSGTFTTGFVIAGSTAKTVLIRGVGPSLRTFGVPNAATQTTLTLNSGSIVLRTNSAWGSAPNGAQIANFGGAFPLTPGSADSVILMTLNPGNYTAQVVSNGAVLLEAYEVP